MNYEFFHSMNKAQALEYFNHFLLEVSEGFETMVDGLIVDNIIVDYTIESLPRLFEWIVPKLVVHPVEEDKSLPQWIRHTKEYTDSLFEYNEESKILINRFAYYFGETFVQSFSKKLKWGIGNPKYMDKNMPVVKGFKKGIEMAPAVIIENMIGELIVKQNFDMPAEVINVWKSKIP